MVKVQQLPNGQLILTVPKKLAEFKGWKKGTIVQFKDHSANAFIIEAAEEEAMNPPPTPQIHCTFFDSFIARAAIDKVAAISRVGRFRQDFVLNITPNSSIVACCSSRW